MRNQSVLYPSVVPLRALTSSHPAQDESCVLQGSIDHQTALLKRNHIPILFYSLDLPRPSVAHLFSVFAILLLHK